MFSISEYRNPARRELRSFGLIVGGAFSVVGLWPAVFRHHPVRFWAIGLAALLVAAAVVTPGALRPFHRVWSTIGGVLGWINSKIIFGLLFYVLLTPARMLMAVVGNDPMNRRFDPDADTYRVLRKARPSSHLRHPF